MGLPAPKELRVFERFDLVDKALPGHLRVAEGAAPLTASAIDVSKQGLGILTGECLAPGTLLELIIDGQVIALRVVWNKRKKTLFRHGLQASDPCIDLETLFFSSGHIEQAFDESDLAEA